MTSKDLSRKAEIPLGKIYSVVLSLEGKNLIQKSESWPQRFYIDDPSSVIDSLIEEVEEEHERMLSDIRRFVTEIDISKSRNPKFFQLGTTSDDDREMQLRSFIEAKSEVCQVLNAHHNPEYDRKNKTLWEKEILKALGRGVVFRSIYHPEARLPPILEKVSNLHPDRFQVRRSDKFFTRCDIVDGKKVLIKMTCGDASDLGLVFIENERFAGKVQEMFETLWEEAGDYDSNRYILNKENRSEEF